MDNYINKAVQRLQTKLPDCEIEYKQIKKNNGVLMDGFIIKEAGNNIAPTFYLTDYDREYLTPEDFARQTAARYEKEKANGINFDVANFTDPEWIKSRVMFEIVNRSRNQGMDLVNIPITPDLMITFKVAVMPNACIRVLNHHLNLWGNITPKELLEEAKKNCIIMDKAVFRSINEVLLDTLVAEYKEQFPSVPEDVFRQRIMNEVFGGEEKLYILSTQQQSNAALLYPQMLEDIRKKLDDNLIILPSSTHEILIMKETDALGMGLDAVKSMVEEVNRDVVMQDNATDFLSNEILRYDGELKQIDSLHIAAEIE